MHRPITGKLIGFLARSLLEILIDEATGREKAIKIDDLASILGVTRRDIECATEEIRDSGVPLCSAVDKPMGLFIARNLSEYEPYRRANESRIRKMSRRLKRMAQTLRMSEPCECVQTTLELG